MLFMAHQDFGTSICILSKLDKEYIVVKLLNIKFLNYDLKYSKIMIIIFKDIL